MPISPPAHIGKFLYPTNFLSCVNDANVAMLGKILSSENFWLYSIIGQAIVLSFMRIQYRSLDDFSLSERVIRNLERIHIDKLFPVQV